MKVSKKLKAMKPLQRLVSDLKTLQQAHVLDEEMKAIAEDTENENITTISELCDVIETEISYWEV